MSARPLAALALALALGAAGSARAAEAWADPLAPETLAVRAVPPPVPADPGAPAWGDAPALGVSLAPQRSIALHDRRANAALATAGPRAATVRALTDGKDLALLVEWADATEDRAGTETDAYGDAAALQLPVRYGAGQRLPYVGMGDAESPVVLCLQRAAADGVIVREAVAKGHGSTTRAELGARLAMERDVARGTWRALFVRPLLAPGHALEGGLVPFAVAVWDGARSERGGNKSLSAWKLLRLPGRPVDPTYETELAWGRRRGELGDAARGRVLVSGMCAACHLVGDRRVARPGIAPDLSSIGAIATPSYLRDSIVSPSAVVVPHPSAAQHLDRARPADARGTFPPNEAFTWSRRDAAGKLASRMPAYAALPAADVNAMVAYLMTLGRPPAEEERP